MTKRNTGTASGNSLTSKLPTRPPTPSAPGKDFCAAVTSRRRGVPRDRGGAAARISRRGGPGAAAPRGALGS